MSFDLTITDVMLDGLIDSIMIDTDFAINLKLNRVDKLFIVKYKVPYKTEWDVLMSSNDRDTLYDNLVLLANFAYALKRGSKDKIIIKWSFEDIEHEIKNLKFSERAYSMRDIWNILDEVTKFSPEITWAVIDDVIRNYMREKDKGVNPEF